MKTNATVIGCVAPAGISANTLAELESAIADRVVNRLCEFVATHRPLSEPTASSWIWLHEDLTLRVTLESTSGITNFLPGWSQRAQFVYLFHSMADATPRSPFHKLVHDERGSIFQQKTTHGTYSVRGRLSPGSEADVLSWDRFRMEPFSIPEVCVLIRSAQFLETVSARIRKFVHSGSSRVAASYLSARGLKDAFKMTDGQFRRGVGPKTFDEALRVGVIDYLAKHNGTETLASPDSLI